MRVLYVATDLRDADILQQEVKRASPKLVLDVCAGAAEARARAERSLNYDAMLLDSSVPEPEQLLLIQHVRSKQIPLPIALLASQTTTPSSALVSAADECILRGPRLGERLAPGLRMAIERYRIVATTLRENDRLKRSEARLRLIIEALPAGVVLIDQTGKILAMNVAGSALVGTSGPSDVVGRDIYSLADADGSQTLRELVVRALGGGRGRADFLCHGPDGAPRRLTFEALCIQRDEAASQGSVLGVLSAAIEAPPAELPIEFSFGPELASMVDERAALEQTLETMRGEVERLGHDVTTERGRVEQLLGELERARANSAEHHAQRAALEEQSRAASARVAALEARQREEQAAMEAVVSRAGTLTGEAGGLRQERERLSHEADALRQELLEQRRQRLELEERIAAADIERDRLTNVLATAQAASETRLAQLDEELRAVKASIAQATARERGLVAELDATKFEAARLGDELGREGEARARFEAELDAVRRQLQHALGTREADQAHVAGRLAELQASLDAALAREHEVRSSLEGAAAQRAEIEQRLLATGQRLAELEQSTQQDATRAAAARDELAQATSRMQWLEGELASAGGARAELESQLAQALSREQALQQDVATAQGGRAELETQLAQALAREQALQQDVATAQSGRADVETQVAQALAREQALQQDVATAQSGRADVETQLAQALAREQALQQDVATAQGGRADVETQLAQALAREQTLQQELAVVLTARVDLDARLAMLEAQAGALDAALADKGVEIEALSGELAATRFEATQLRDDLSREVETRVRLEADLDARVFDLSTLRASSDADRDVFHARIAELEGDAAASRERERALAQRVERQTELETAMAEMEARRQAAVARIAELEERRRNEQSALTAAAQRETDLSQEMLALREEVARLSEARDTVAQDLARERDARQGIEDELTVRGAELGRVRSDLESQLSARDADLATLRADVAAGGQALLDAQEQAARLEVEHRAAVAKVEAELARRREALEEAAERELALATELGSLQRERDSRGRQAFDLEAVVTREREERVAAQARLTALERESADATARAEARISELSRDHQEVVARLQKLLEQAAAREFQAATLARPNPGDRGRRRPAEKIGQLAAAMANDLNNTIAEVAEDARRLLGELPEGANSRARAEQTLQTATRAGQLVRHLLRLSEREARLVPRVELSALVRGNEALLRQLVGADIDLRFELAAGLPHVECDAEEVVQVLSTLVVTVRGSLPLGGIVRVATQDRGREGRRRSDQVLVLGVTAEGYGMVPVATAVCEEVVTRCGGTFTASVDQAQAVTSLQVTLPAEARNAEAAPGWSQTA